MVTAQPEPSISEEELEQLAQLAIQMTAERRAALDSFAVEVENKFSVCRGKRVHKEAEWTEARALILPESPALVGSSQQLFGSNTEHTVRKKKFNVVRPKVRIAHSQLVAMQFGAGDKNWMLGPSKSPEAMSDIPLDEAARAMEAEIADQLDRADYGREARMAMWDMIVLGTGVMKGPSNCDRLKKTWQRSVDSYNRPVYVPVLSRESVPVPRRVDPWMFFPDHTVADIRNADYVIEAHPYSKRDLAKFRAHDKFEQDVLEEVLEEAPKDYWFQTIVDSQNSTNYEIFRDKYTVLEYNGVASSDCACAIKPELEPNGAQMWVQAFIVNGKCIYFDSFDLEAIDTVPYAVGVWEPDASSIFGFGMPIAMSGHQRVIDGNYDLLIENAKLSSGPQIVVNTALVDPESGSDGGGYALKPWKVWTVNAMDVDVQKVFQQFTPQSNQSELSSIIETARAFADEESGVPLIAGGLESPEVGTSATGAALMMKAGTSVLNIKSQEWDDQVTKPMIRWMYDWNMAYHPNDQIKGDFEVDVTTPTSMIRKHIEVQNLEKLMVEIAQGSPIGAELKMDVLARARIAGMMLPTDKFMKSAEEKAQDQQAAAEAQQQDPAMLEIQVKQQEVEVNREKVALEREKLQWESTRGQQRDMWEHEERMQNTIARREENQYQFMGKQLEKEIALIQLAQKEGIAMAELEAKYNIAAMSEETKIALASMQLDLDARKQRTTEQELLLSAVRGKGI